MCVGDFNSKLEAFRCAKKNISGSMLNNIQSHLTLSSLNNDEQGIWTRDRQHRQLRHGIHITVTKRDIQFLIGVDLGSNHLPIEILTDAQFHRNIHISSIRYKFNQTDKEVFESTLEVALSSGDVPELKSTQDIDKYADFIITAISTAVDKALRVNLFQKDQFR